MFYRKASFKRNELGYLVDDISKQCAQGGERLILTDYRKMYEREMN